MKIAHLSDIHIRFSSRIEEYKEVFERLYKDLRLKKPNRITVVGDLNHQKINMSPSSLDLSAEFLVSLAKIAPVDVFLGNHDMNMSQKEQGDSITPIFTVVQKFKPKTENSKDLATEIVNMDNVDGIDFNRKGIYFYPDSGFYKIQDDLVYGVYSCKDEEILTLEKKEKGVNYIAFYHGRVYGARGDNGYEMFGADLMNQSTFNNFDIVMLGDIHEFQTFRDDETMAYCGSLIQQNYGESLDKGYLVWDVENKTFERRQVLNDHGFSKITIAKGELFEERLSNLRFSNDKTKTKVYIVWEDYEENYSTEKESQIIKFVKDKYGCEVVKINFVALEKEESGEENEVDDAKNKETFINQLRKFVEDGENDFDDVLISELLSFANKIDDELEIEDEDGLLKTWDIEEVEICNIFSFGEKPEKIQFNKHMGLTGIFGTNYTGKSNTIKAIIWGLYQQILGGGDSKKLINIYTNSNEGYVKILLNINGEKYRVLRKVTTKSKKDGTSANTYSIDYEKMVVKNGKEKWVSEISDKTATEKVEVKRMIVDAIGSMEDFTKVSLQTQDGEGSYLNQKQQPKNDLINRYMGLQFFRDRYAHANELFKEVKKKQKSLGDIVELEEKLKNINEKINRLETEIKEVRVLKTESETKKDGYDKKILELTKKLKNTEPLNNNEYNNLDSIDLRRAELLNSVAVLADEKTELEKWLSLNFKKEFPFHPDVTLYGLNKDYENEDRKFQAEKKQFLELKKWVEENPVKQVFDLTSHEAKIMELNNEIAMLNSKLPLYRGAKCPTCGHVTQNPDPNALQACSIEIENKKQEINKLNIDLQNNKSAVQHNSIHENSVGKLENLKNSLILSKERKENISKSIELFKNSEGIKTHNEEVENKSKRLNFVINEINNINSQFPFLDRNEEKLKNNLLAENHNKSLEVEIESLTEQVKGYKMTIYNLDNQITEKSGDLRIEKNNLDNYTDKLKEVKEEEKKYKIYSMYLQAVHRDGIPSRIIKNKLPVVNNKINSILNTVVDFQVELKVLKNGDITEDFYFSEDKSDALPLASSGSGSQKFISSLVIKDALHYISNLMKPSINIIDEGFGSLDDDKTSGIANVLYYLKNKYKNVLIITHKNEIKDYVDNIIDAYKDSTNISEEVLKINPKAGITRLNIG